MSKKPDDFSIWNLLALLASCGIVAGIVASIISAIFFSYTFAGKALSLAVWSGIALVIGLIMDNQTKRNG